jgi:hypothetical protein
MGTTNFCYVRSLSCTSTLACAVLVIMECVHMCAKRHICVVGGSSRCVVLNCINVAIFAPPSPCAHTCRCAYAHTLGVLRPCILGCTTCAACHRPTRITIKKKHRPPQKSEASSAFGFHNYLLHHRHPAPGIASPLDYCSLTTLNGPSPRPPSPPPPPPYRSAQTTSSLQEPEPASVLLARRKPARITHQ